MLQLNGLTVRFDKRCVFGKKKSSQTFNCSNWKLSFSNFNSSFDLYAINIKVVWEAWSCRRSCRTVKSQMINEGWVLLADMSNLTVCFMTLFKLYCASEKWGKLRTVQAQRIIKVCQRYGSKPAIYSANVQLLVSRWASIWRGARTWKVAGFNYFRTPVFWGWTGENKSIFGNLSFDFEGWSKMLACLSFIKI